MEYSKKRRGGRRWRGWGQRWELLVVWRSQVPGETSAKTVDFPPHLLPGIAGVFRNSLDSVPPASRHSMGEVAVFSAFEVFDAFVAAGGIRTVRIYIYPS